MIDWPDYYSKRSKLVHFESAPQLRALSKFSDEIKKSSLIEIMNTLPDFDPARRLFVVTSIEEQTLDESTGRALILNPYRYLECSSP